jgi:hypothetical protein
MAKYMLIHGGGKKVLDASVICFGHVPIGGKSSVGEAVFVQRVLLHSCDQSFIVGSVDEWVEDDCIAVLCKMVKEACCREHAGSFSAVGAARAIGRARAYDKTTPVDCTEDPKAIFCESSEPSETMWIVAGGVRVLSRIRVSSSEVTDVWSSLLKSAMISYGFSSSWTEAKKCCSRAGTRWRYSAKLWEAIGRSGCVGSAGGTVIDQQSVLVSWIVTGTH